MKTEFLVIYNPSNLPFFRWELWSKGEQTYVMGGMSCKPSIETKVETKRVGQFHSEEKACQVKDYLIQLNAFRQNKGE